jgi:hypothetical protein
VNKLSKLLLNPRQIVSGNVAPGEAQAERDAAKRAPAREGAEGAGANQGAVLDRKSLNLKS